MTPCPLDMPSQPVTIDAARHSPYCSCGDAGKNTKSGLWAYPDMPDPNAIISRELPEPPTRGHLPCGRIIARDENLDRSTASFYVGFGGCPALSIWRQARIPPERHPLSPSRRGDRGSTGHDHNMIEHPSSFHRHARTSVMAAIARPSWRSSQSRVFFHVSVSHLLIPVGGARRGT